MEFRTIVARKPGKCQRCQLNIVPGDRIRWAAGRGSYHLASECVASQPGELIVVGVTETGVEFAPAEYVTTTHDTPQGLVRRTELVKAKPLVQAVKLPDADAMLAAFGVKS